MSETYDEICRIEAHSRDVLGKIREASFAPQDQKRLMVLFPMREVERMVGRSSDAIRLAEKEGKVPPPAAMRDGRRIGYSLEEVNRLRTHFDTLPHRKDDEEPLILPIQNVKGGVGKSTLTVHLAHYFALLGYRVLVVDADPQATTTSFSGLNPDSDVSRDETLYPYLTGAEVSLESVIRKTYFPQVDLIPAQLGLNDAEADLAAQMQSNPAEVLDDLREGIMEVAPNYDVVLLDPAPALGTIPLQVMRAANALLCPIRPSTTDFSASANFFTMLREAVGRLEAVGCVPVYNWIRVVANDVQTSKKTHMGVRRKERDKEGRVLRETREEGMVDLMRQIYGSVMLQTVVRDSAEIDNAAAGFASIFEATEAATSKEVRRRALSNIRNFCREVETLMRLQWPSHQESLQAQGLV